MTRSGLTAEQVLARIPQREPFRFIDEILELDPEHIVAAYRFRPEADFYRGHFPGQPITPGALLIETMAQAAVVALGIFLVSIEESSDDLDKLVTLFTDANVEFSGAVNPGDRVTVHGTKVFFRRRKLRSLAEMRLADGSVVCSGTLSGMGVPR
ncbi:MAG: 3-hydroxyacyl-ACP dehydratase FabZ family protein [Myxococcota bacterium]